MLRMQILGTSAQGLCSDFNVLVLCRKSYKVLLKRWAQAGSFLTERFNVMIPI